MAIIPIIKKDVVERTTCWVTISFLDRDGVPAVPSTLTCRIDDQDSGTAIREETSVTPGSTVEIRISPEENRILYAGSEAETREVTIHATFGAEDEQNANLLYRVINLRFME